jgi:hypothetical protein
MLVRSFGKGCEGSLKLEPRALDLTIRIRSAGDDLTVMKGYRIQRVWSRRVEVITSIGEGYRPIDRCPGPRRSDVAIWPKRLKGAVAAGVPAYRVADIFLL